MTKVESASELVQSKACLLHRVSKQPPPLFFSVYTQTRSAMQCPNKTNAWHSQMRLVAPPGLCKPITACSAPDLLDNS